MGEYQDDYKANRANNLGINIHEYPLKILSTYLYLQTVFMIKYWREINNTS